MKRRRWAQSRQVGTFRYRPVAARASGSSGSARLDGVPGGFGGVGPPGRGGPPEGAVGELVHFPSGVLLEPVVVTALRAGVTQTGTAACFVGGVVLVVALGGGPPADGAGAGGVPDLGQVPEPGPGVVTFGLESVVAGVGGDRVQGDDQAGPGSGGAQPPGAIAAGRPVPAGRGEAEPRRSGAGAFAVALGSGPGAAVPDGVSLVVGDGQAPRGLRVAGGGGGQVAGQPRVDRAQAGQLAGPAGQAGQGGQRDGQGDPAGEPRGDRAGRSRRRAGSRRGGSPGPGAGPGRPGRAARPCRPPARRPSVPAPGR